MTRTLTRTARSVDPPEAVFVLWCEVTGHDPDHFDEPELSAFLARAEVEALAGAPRSALEAAALQVLRGRSLPLERWLAAVRSLRHHWA